MTPTNTKLLWFQGEFPIPKVDRITLGHEFAGEIVELGTSASAKTDLKIGNKVAIDPNL